FEIACLIKLNIERRAEFLARIAILNQTSQRLRRRGYGSKRRHRVLTRVAGGRRYGRLSPSRHTCPRGVIAVSAATIEKSSSRVASGRSLCEQAHAPSGARAKIETVAACARR